MNREKKAEGIALRLAEIRWNSSINRKCKCGAVIGLYFSNRLARYVCPNCLDKEVESLILKVDELEERNADLEAELLKRNMMVQ